MKVDAGRHFFDGKKNSRLVLLWCLASTHAHRRAGIAPAAVFGQKAQQTVHRRVICRIDHEATTLLHRHEIRIRQLFHVKGQRRRCNAQPLGDLTGGHPARTDLHKQSKDGQPGLLSQGAQGADDRICFHISILIEIWSVAQLRCAPRSSPSIRQQSAAR
ncbi:protein of unknown function [Burkholderia multivorans]